MSNAAVPPSAEPAPPQPVKRGRGRPRGSKNKPDAGTKGRPVGRPRKKPLPSAEPTVAPPRHSAKEPGTSEFTQSCRAAGHSINTGTPCDIGPNTARHEQRHESTASVSQQQASISPRALETRLRELQGHTSPDKENQGQAHRSEDASTEHATLEQTEQSLNSTGCAHTESTSADVPGITTDDCQGPSTPPPTPGATPSARASRKHDYEAARASAILAHAEQARAGGEATGHDAGMTRGQEGAEEEDDSLDFVLGHVEFPADIYEDARPPADDDEIEEDEPRFGNEPESVRNAGSGCAKPRPTLPYWLKHDYAETCERLRAEMQENPSRRPACYDSGRFTLSPRHPLFVSERLVQINPALFYLPEYFVWLPHLFHRIPCPGCRQSERRDRNSSPVMLRCSGWPRAPRRVVDMDRNTYIIGYRYYCGHPDCRKTYQSWSPAILAVLPPPLASSFPFHLTYRNGLSDQLLALLRSSFQRGVGPSPFVEMIRSFHIRRYEQLHVQYLEMIKTRLHLVASRFTALFTEFSDWDDLYGYAGYIPTERFFRNVYDNLIEAHAHEIDQYSAMLPATIICADHSHKVPKHLVKVEGEEVFSAMHTVVNEYGECRAMTLTPTKAHNQFMPLLARIPHSLRYFGHSDIQLVFTDNVRADKPELERVFPSLLQDVEPVPSSSLTPLKIPSSWSVVQLRTTFQVNGRMNNIMDDLAALPETSSLPLAMDMEWSVDRESGVFGLVALISIVYQQAIYLIPLPFVGALELGALAKERGIVERANTSLSDLVAHVLHRYLPKDDSIRVSSGWDNNELSQVHVDYAALDVYAAWALHDMLTSSTSVGSPVTDMTLSGTRVKLLSRDRNSIVAYGVLAPDRPSSFQGVNVTKTRAVINVTDVLQGGYLIRKELLATKEDVPISRIAGACPFQLLCAVRDLVTCTPGDAPPQTQVSPLPSLHEPLSSRGTPTADPDEIPGAAELSTDDMDMLDWHNSLRVDNSEASELDAVTDSASCAHATALFNAVPPLSYQESEIRSRVLGDIWHLMDQFKISVHHGFRRPFARALRDALLLPDPADQAAVERVLESRGVSWRQMVLTKPDWVWRRVRRFVPKPDVLHQRIKHVLLTYGPFKDATTGQPLFNDASWQKAVNVLENVRAGYYSDPPGIQLYMVCGKDREGLTLYRCVRGTNNVEGGIHQNVIRRFGSFNASPRFAVNLLRDYRLCHNLKVGTLNRTGMPYRGSYDIWMRNRLASLRDQTAEAFPLRVGLIPRRSVDAWVNGDDYTRTDEVFGLLPVPETTRQKLGMLAFHSDFARREKIRHRYLAHQQQTRVAILPVHTPEERALYRMLAKQPAGYFAGPRQPNWVSLATEWSKYADGVHIFYKLPEHLKNYYKTWVENRNEENSVEQYRAAYERLKSLLAPRAGAMPTILTRPQQGSSARTVIYGNVDDSAAIDITGGSLPTPSDREKVVPICTGSSAEHTFWL
ncbi:hypothetical protein BV20DRAFT_1113655 [Pilatotrama ljubarskyi]|nr:hypothetical protein BV20DRAFT_1113655 [Pilatotrama ljubarskyi]